MSALIVIALAAAWMLVGYLLWRRLIQPRIGSTSANAAVGFPLAALWLIAPVADEILGAREFEKLCREMPEIKFHGPVPVGPGAFFDEQGKPRWTNSDEFSAIERATPAQDKIFHHPPSEWHLLRQWPMPISESYGLYVDRRTGKPVLETYARYSPGGWIKRGLGWGSHAPYQCPRKGYFPRDELWMVFASS